MSNNIRAAGLLKAFISAIWNDAHYRNQLRPEIDEARNVIKALEAEPTTEASPGAQLTGDGWRPIETAPKDGTLVDLWGSYGHGPSFRKAGYGWQDGRWLNEDGEDASDYPKYIFQPSYWMPLPAAPTTSGEG